MSKKLKTIAIIGGGPAGASLGALLARQNYTVGIFHTDKRPPLIVGESLIPPVIPMLRALGIEDEVKAFSIYKAGATIALNRDEVISAPFTNACGKLPPYAYNTDRNLFDSSVLRAAEKAGARVFKGAAKLEKDEQANTVRLTSETLDLTDHFFGGKPDFIVDASGRVRSISRLLDAPVVKGGRDDVALFAHLENASIKDPGHIHLDYLTKGWSWRIPLPGKVSLGFVIDPKHLQRYGTDIESQYEGYIRDEPSLKMYVRDARRVTPVAKYQNYQLISKKMHGPGWAMIGDAAGFIDPIWSTGLYLGMKGAFELFTAIESGTPRAMQKYEDRSRRQLRMWQRVADTWYNGFLFNLYRAGQMYKDHPIGARLAPRIQKRLARILTGEATDNTFSMKLFESLMGLGTLLRDPQDLAII